MNIVRVPEGRADIVSEFIEKSAFTFEGLDISDKKGLKELEKLMREAGYREKDFILWVISGKMMNELFSLTDTNAYPDDLNLVVIKNFYNPAFKIASGARWFDDIVANNSIRQNGITFGHEPDYEIDEEED